MLRHVSLRSIVGLLLALGMVGGGLLFAQQTERGTQQRGGAQVQQGEGPRASNAPPVLKVEWVRPRSQTAQVPVIQENIAAVILKMDHVPVMDITGLVALESSVSRLLKSGRPIYLCGVKKQPFKLIGSSSTFEQSSKIHFVDTLEAALTAIKTGS